MKFTLQPVDGMGGWLALHADGVIIPGQTSVSVNRSYDEVTTITIEFVTFRSGGIQFETIAPEEKKSIDPVAVAKPAKEEPIIRRRIRLRRA